jgi:hypothetical protein
MLDATESATPCRSPLRLEASPPVPPGVFDESGRIRLRMRQVLDSTTLTDRDLDWWEQDVQERGHAFKTHPARDMLVDVLADLDELLAHAGRGRPRTCSCGCAGCRAGLLVWPERPDRHR